VTLAKLLARGHEVNNNPIEMLLYLDGFAAPKKAMFRCHSGLPAYTRSELVSEVRYSVLPAPYINVYLSGAILVVEGAVTQAK
jgi:hypothetical protein